MKYTEGAFKTWGYEVALTEFKEHIITEEQLTKEYNGVCPKEGLIIIKDRLADAMFQHILISPKDYSVLALPNLNGDYMSDALVAQVGGLGLAPGANIGDEYAVFEATHGSAPKYTGMNKANPGSLILSGVMMFIHIGWTEAAQLIEQALQKTILDKTVTYDLARLMEDARILSTSEFASAIVNNLQHI